MEALAEGLEAEEAPGGRGARTLRYGPVTRDDSEHEEARRHSGRWPPRRVVCAGALVLALSAAVCAVAVGARWERPASANLRPRESLTVLEENQGKEGGGGKGADGHAGASDADTPPGCCSWAPPHCGEVKGKCRGGVEACVRCKGQWINPNATLCERGHSLEKPLPKLWNYTSSAGKHPHVKVLSYNLFWWKLFDKLHGAGGIAGQNIKKSVKGEPYDVMGFQECGWPYQPLWDAGFHDEYKAFHSNNNICIAYRKAAWELLAHGEKIVAQDASWAKPGQNYGQRAAQWVRLRRKKTNETLFFMNHHGPLPLSSGGDWGGPETARKLLQVIASSAEEGDAVIFVGDFNSDLHSMTVRQVGCRLNRILSGTKFGGIDHIFTNVDRSQVVSTAVLPQGGSDHNALNAVVSLGREAGAHD